MALIWETEQDGVRYEVRRAGQTLRLYANGVQHSEFHPKRLLTGSVWDLLWLPALLHEPARFRRVLVLGLGGGSESLIDGSMVTVDEAYVRESIVNPSVKVVDGFAPVMLAYDLPESDMESLMVFLRSTETEH